jgi:1-deoxy-D-xylulose-5-phosphate reductoisomerase
MRRIVILGSTGSIGRQTLDIVRAFPDEFEVVGLSAGNNTELLKRQMEEFSPRHVWSAVAGPGEFPGVSFTPMEQMVALNRVDQVMVALMGSVGLTPTLTALAAGKSVALSNKEPIVMAGKLIKDYEASYGGRVLPVDSEPSAIWQCLQGEPVNENGEWEILRLLITASGGPFRTTPLEDMESVTPEQALRHPTWRMGQKITIDSATLMNKAFEVIESHWLFGVPWERIEVVVHPQSTIHSMVEFADGSVKAQMGPPDMRLPIQYALFYPQRLPNAMIPRLDTTISHSLTFDPLEPERYPCFSLAVEAGRKGGTYPAVLSAADEVAVQAFLDGKISYGGIHRLVERILAEHEPLPGEDAGEVLEADAWASARALELAGG